MTESVIDTRFVVQAEFDPDRGGMVDVYCAVEAVWREVNPTLGENRKGRVTDTGAHKIGDGVTAWNDLPWSVGPAMGEHEREMRNRDTRGIVDHWLDRLVDVEGTVHKTLVDDGQDMVVTLIITGRCPSNLTVEEARQMHPLDQMVKILMANGVEVSLHQVRSMRLWLESGQSDPLGYCMRLTPKHEGPHPLMKKCLQWKPSKEDADLS